MAAEQVGMLVEPRVATSARSSQHSSHVKVRQGENKLNQSEDYIKAFIPTHCRAREEVGKIPNERHWRLKSISAAAMPRPIGTRLHCEQHAPIYVLVESFGFGGGLGNIGDEGASQTSAVIPCQVSRGSFYHRLDSDIYSLDGFERTPRG
jgi:hypothetical protein